MLIDTIPWILSVWTLLTMWLAGNQKTAVKAWVSGLGAQVLWVAFILLSQTWGLMPLSIALFFVYGRNLKTALSTQPYDVLTPSGMSADTARFFSAVYEAYAEELDGGLGRPWSVVKEDLGL